MMRESVFLFAGTLITTSLLAYDAFAELIADDYELAAIAPAAGVQKAPEATATTLGEIFTKGTPSFQAQWRYESVHQGGFDRDANASTLRTRLGFATAPLHGLSAMAELQNVSNIGSERYNNTANGRTSYPTIADPEYTILNQLFARYQGVADTTVHAGRRRMKLDNERFIGFGDWRQNGQTLNGASIENASIKDLTLFYHYGEKVHRPFAGSETQSSFHGNMHLFNARYSGLPKFGTLTAYGYRLGFDNTPSFASQTYGASLDGLQELGQGVALLYRAEYAQQRDLGVNPTQYRADYVHLSPALRFHDFTLRAAYEQLGSDEGRAAVQTPLATLHAFNGWADKFLTIPANGLRDVYGVVSYRPSGVPWLADSCFTVRYDDYRADYGGSDYGTEWGMFAEKKFYERYTVGVKFADYTADSFATDTQKFWLYAQARF